VENSGKNVVDVARKNPEKDGWGGYSGKIQEKCGDDKNSGEGGEIRKISAKTENGKIP
jgi:hypothetical protein